MRRGNAITLVSSLTAFAVLTLVVPQVSLFGRQIDLIIATVLLIATQMLVIRAICALQPRFTLSGIVFIVSLMAFLGLLWAKRRLGANVWLELPLDTARILSAAFLGYLVSFALRDRNIVLPIAGFAAYLDMWFVAWGPTKYVIDKAPQIVQEVSAPIPIPGGHGELASVIGPADLVFLAVFFGAIYRLKMEPTRTYWIVLPLLAASMILVNSTNLIAGLPALIPMSIGVIAANYRSTNFTRQEKLSVAVVGGLLLLALGAFLIWRAGR